MSYHLCSSPGRISLRQLLTVTGILVIGWIGIYYGIVRPSGVAQAAGVEDANLPHPLHLTDDSGITLSAVTEEEGGYITIRVELDAAATEPVKITLLYTNQTASSADYTPVSEIFVPAGAISASFTMQFIDDTLVEGVETFLVTALREGKIVQSAPAILVTILDNDVVLLGNLIWHDYDNNGLRDPGEPGLANVTVNLYRFGNIGDPFDGSLIMTTTTDANGFYQFALATLGKFVLEIMTPPGFRSSAIDAGAPDIDLDDNDDNGVGAGEGVIRAEPLVINVQAASVNLTIDFGLWRPLSLGNLVWNDYNNSGLVDNGERGLAEIVVRLYADANRDDLADGAALKQALTDHSGHYLFTELISGTYIVEALLPISYTSSTVEGGDPDNDIDNDDNGFVRNADAANVVRSAGVRLSPGSEPLAEADGNTLLVVVADQDSNLTVDLGLWIPQEFSGRIWSDRNNNQRYDEGEPGIAGMKINLYRADLARTLDQTQASSAAQPIQQTATTITGSYQFSNVAPGDYYLGIAELPSDLDYSSASGQELVTGQPITTTTITLEPGSTPVISGEGEGDLDFGFVELSSLGDLVWFDEDKDGVQDVFETGEGGQAIQKGVPGVTAFLYQVNGALAMTTTTDGTGHYRFHSVMLGDYYVRFQPPPGYVVTAHNAAGNTAFDSDSNNATLRTAAFTLAAGEHRPNLDLGLYLGANAKPAFLGDRVWYDTDQDGLQDAGEKGVPGVSVHLLQANGSLLAATQSDANGHYRFNYLLPGDYALQMIVPSGYRLTVQNAGADDAADSDAVIANGKTPTVTLTADETNFALDFGLVASAPPIAVGDRVWYDANVDGIQDDAEGGIPGVAVILYNTQGVPLAQTVTDSAGKYLFENLVSGAYSVGFIKPFGYQFSLPNRGDKNKDSDADILLGRSGRVSLLPGESNLTLDAGLYIPAAPASQMSVSPSSLGDRVWSEEDNDGNQAPGEPGLAGVTVKLYGSQGEWLASDISDAEGRYLFSSLKPGDYYLEFAPPIQDNNGSFYAVAPHNSTGSEHDSDVDPQTGRTTMIRLSSGVVNLDQDAGYYQRAVKYTFLPLVYK